MLNASKVIFRTIHEYPINEPHDHPFNHGFVEAYGQACSLFKDIHIGMMEVSGCKGIHKDILSDIPNTPMQKWIEVFEVWETDKAIIEAGLLSKFRHDYLAGQALQAHANHTDAASDDIANPTLADLFVHEFQAFTAICQKYPNMLHDRNSHSGIEHIVESLSQSGLNAPFSHWLYWIDFCSDARRFIDLATPSIHQYSNIEQLFEDLG